MAVIHCTKKRRGPEAENLEALFRSDGSPVGIGFLAGIKGNRGWQRPPSIRVELGDKNSKRLCRTINVCRTANFDEAWERAVGFVLEYYGIPDTAEIRAHVRTGFPGFLARYGIRLKTIRVLDVAPEVANA